MRGALPDTTLDAVLAANAHGAYCVPVSSLHRPASRAVLRSRVFEPETIRFIEGLDPSGDIVHAGTFFGDFLPALARSRRDGALVWAFEPSSENLRCAQVTVLLNDLDNVVLTHGALTDRHGCTGLLAVRSHDGEVLGGASHLVGPAVPASGAVEQVPLVRVDDVVGADRHVAVIQLDVERHEEQALNGALATIARCRPVLVLETVPDEAWVAATLGPLGFRVSHTVHDNTVLVAD